MRCSNCVSVPSEEAYVFIEDKESNISRELTLPLCEECFQSFGETGGVTVSRTETIDQERGR
ncbi:MAG: hypothetical protein ACI9CA_001316 [Natronomonas sp.]|jgi:hypothetical protein